MSGGFYLQEAIRPLRKYARYLYTHNQLKDRRRKMIKKFQLKGGMKEPSLDIPKLYAIPCPKIY